MSAINLVSMDFEDIKTSLKTFLKQQDEFKDYNFDGSGLSVLLNVLAYDAQQTAYLANMLANESNIDTAVLRENVVSRAKVVGYVPKSRKAAKATISVTISDPLNEATSLLLPRGTKFLAGGGGSVFTFITLQDYNLFLNETSGLYENNEVEIYEGIIKAASWVIDDGVRCVINSTKIDTETLRVGVFPSYNTTDGIFYTRARTLEKIKNDSTVFWVNETDGQRFEVVFGDGVFGLPPKKTNVVYAEYLNTSGTEANGYTRFSLAGNFAGYENSQVTIATIDASNGGSEAESTSSIKINAPRAYAAQGKATVSEDYASLVKDMYPYANAVNTWGGDEEVPVKYGKVFISVIPTGGGVLTEYTKQNLARELKKKGVAGITPVFVDAEYVFLNMTAHVSVRKNAVSQLKSFSTEIRNMIVDFFNNRFYSFDSSFYYSNLVTAIETLSRSITNAKVVFELSMKATVAKKEFNFKNAIVPGTVRSNKLSIPQNASALSIVDRNGSLHLGETVVGAVDYESGMVKITHNSISSTDNSLEVFMTPVNDDVLVSNRLVVALDQKRLAVELQSV